MSRNLDKPDIELSQDRGCGVPICLSDLCDRRQASIPIFDHVRGQAQQYFADFSNPADGMTVIEREI